MQVPVSVVILQDAQERKCAKSTVPLLQLALPQLEVVAADDDLTVAELKARVQQAPEQWGLVYPTADSQPVEGLAANKDVTRPTAWLLPDGTWKKTRRLLHEHPWLTKITAYSFSQAPVSNYRIRKVPSPSACSTLESVAWVLQQVHHVDPSPLHELQRHFVARWQAYQPDAHQR